jgi:DNA helicase-2/ATP-dependent DNA helicase PcrA
MTNLFNTAEAEAARQFFYFMASRPGIDEAAVERVWQEARLGVDAADLRSAIEKTATVRTSLKDNDEQRFRLYSIQRLFLTFLENAGIREERVADGRGEVVFYNLGKFSQLISDFETIHYHSKPAEKYRSFADFLEYRAETYYPEGWQDNQYANPDAVRIMTVHQAKGMQWPVVFIPALLKNRFPGKKAGGRNVWHLLPRAGVMGQARYEGSIEDERRLFYVAMTRSQKFLHLTWAPVTGNSFRRSPNSGMTFSYQNGLSAVRLITQRANACRRRLAQASRTSCFPFRTSSTSSSAPTNSSCAFSSGSMHQSMKLWVTASLCMTR